MFRGKESSNRIELSRLVQDIEFWCFRLPKALGGGRWMGGIWGMGGVSTCTHMHVHACTCMHAHVYMYRNCKWPLTWRHPCLSCLTCMCMCPCMCLCMCACIHTWDTPHTPIPTPTPIHLSTTPPEDPRNHLKFDKA